MNTIARTTALLALVSAAGLAGWWLGGAGAARDATHDAAQHAASAPDAPREVLYWYDPMKPEVHFDAPGPSPFMDMDLVPKYADEVQGGLVKIDPRMVQNLGMRNAPVVRDTFWQRVDASGLVEADEGALHAIEARADGWVERLAVRSADAPVRAGMPVAWIYSPAILVAQEELLLAQQRGDVPLRDAARDRLRLLGLTGGQVDAIVAAGKPQRQVALLSPVTGYLAELNLREGEAVAPGRALARVVDLARVWVTVDVPEAQAGWLRAGRPAEVTVPAHPGRIFEGKIDYLYPRVDAATRTMRARIVLANPDLVLRPGMFAAAALYGGPRREVLLVPEEAVIRTGEREVVILVEGEGEFRPVVVRTGATRNGQTEVLEGLLEGNRVVTSGQFLIDSEASLRGAFPRLAAPEGDAHDAHAGHQP
jgi:Cu(I)/Ag(I) efflux system membrane fusion protein